MIKKYEEYRINLKPGTHSCTKKWVHLMGRGNVGQLDHKPRVKIKDIKSKDHKSYVNNAINFSQFLYYGIFRAHSFFLHKL